MEPKKFCKSSVKFINFRTQLNQLNLIERQKPALKVDKYFKESL